MDSRDTFNHIPRVTSLALGQSYDCPSASEVTLENMGKTTSNKPQQKTTNTNCVHISWEVLYIISSNLQESSIQSGLRYRTSSASSIPLLIGACIHNEDNVLLV